MSPGAPRRRLVPQPAPPCRGPYAGVQHRHRLRASVSSPVTHRAVTVRFAACETLASPRFPAPPPGGRLRLAPWPDARPCADGALRHGPTEQRPPGQSLLRPRTAAAVAAAAPPFPSVCLVCESVLSVTPVPASCVSPPRLRLSSHSEIYLSRISSEKSSLTRRTSNSLLSRCRLSRVVCARRL